MNREIKFRIWDKQNKNWLKNSSSLHCYSNWAICPFTGNLVDYVGAIDGDHGESFTASPAADYYLEGVKFVKESRYVIQQYTGLKDKNGVEIYEGDICNAGIVIGDVDYSIGGFYLASNPLMVYFKGYPDNMNVLSPDWDCSWIDVEVIGNICENPDFLKTMSKQLKFRIWDKQDKSFLSEEYLKHFKVAIAWDGQNIYQNFICGDKKVDDEVIIQQYTGLKDSKGVEIYEGDLVCYSTAEYSTIAPVVFSPFGHGFVLDSFGRHGIGDSKHGNYIAILPLIVSKRATYEVVGNIFETKKDNSNE